MLQNGHPSGIYGDLNFYLKAINAKDQRQPLQFAPPLVAGSMPAYLWLRKGAPLDWKTRLKEAAEALRSEGTLDEIVSRYR